MAFDITHIPEAPVQPVTQSCLLETAQRFELPLRLLQTILMVEGGRVGEYRKNTNGTYDLGPMQVNTIWVEHFKPYISPTDILYNGCVNLQVGAWILRANINWAEGDFWKGVGNYHSKTPELHTKYREKVYLTSQLFD